MSDLEKRFEQEMEEEISTEYEEPSTEYEEPSTEYEEPSTEYEEPSTEYEEPSTEYEKSDLGKEFELEMENDSELSTEIDSDIKNELAQRFFELSQNESVSEVEVDKLMNKAETEFFFKRLLKKKGPLKSLFRLGGKFVKGLPAFQGINAITQLARGDLTGTLGSLAKTGMASVFPGSGHVLQGLGMSEITENSENNLELWNKFVNLSETAYDELANNYDEHSIRNPVIASQLAAKSFRNAVSKHKGIRTGTYGRAGKYTPRKKAYKFRVKRGDYIKFKVEGY